ncbi:MAG: glycoside hydrolase family 32 protein [Fusobacteriaceae bacterium]|nr:glycoside hydrolase family 32 protein [Fusobacteriaceae bacterium]MBN2837747.1 glycoside hydrolase family 32 protein [Fusobacteriaceae bacterium]
MTKLEKANTFIKENRDKTGTKPSFHFVPEIGWINDPNGFCFYQGKYHLFYQYYPYDIKWNDMHWGHAVSEDLTTWEHLPVAMANDTIADANGCFSGSSIEKDGKLHLLYTGNINPNMGFKSNLNEMIQHQCLAISEDGINFQKYANNPVISQYDLPNGYIKTDFRDPKVIEKDGTYFVVIAGKNSYGRGDILLYKSNDLIKWNFISIVYKTVPDENIMIECPDLFSIDGKEILMFSVMACNEEFEKEVGNKTEYIIGTLNFENGSFDIEHKDIMDYGHSFYAPQSMEDKKGRRISIGWMKKWVYKTLTPPEELGWNGMMSLPRLLSIQNGMIIQKPFVGINNYFKNKSVSKNLEVNGELFLENFKNVGMYLKFEIISDSDNEIIINLFKNKDNSIKLAFNLRNNFVTYISTYDNINETYNLCGYAINKNGISMDIYIDTYSIELFLNSGEKVFSYTNFTIDRGKEISIESQKTSSIKYYEKCDIII